MKILIVDYGMGNIKSIFGALRFIGVNDITLSNTYNDIQNADKIILPGVGSFAEAMHNINAKNIKQYLQEMVVANKKPILGICLGMQLMGLSSTENGENAGLGFINATVTKFSDHNLKIPHVGFNQVNTNPKLRLYSNMDGEKDFYFTHSFKMNYEKNINPCLCTYGEKFVASFEVDNIAGVQFHPEISQNNGLKLLRNFIEKF